MRAAAPPLASMYAASARKIGPRRSFTSAAFVQYDIKKAPSLSS
jgi:hypothetical protein